MDKRIYLDLTPIDDSESSSVLINIDADIQAIEKCDGGSLVRMVGIAYKVRESQQEIITMLNAEVKCI